MMGEIGFASLPDQLHRKSVKRGFAFTLMVVGETGLGKSTMVNSLFLTDLYKDRKASDVRELTKKTVSIERKTVDIEEKGVKLKLTIVDTPGFGDGLNCQENWESIEKYVTDQFEKYLEAESGVNRRNIQDTRIHCCLYFIPPWGRGLRPLDIEFLKRLGNKVNIIPLIGKSDTLTPSESKTLKENVRKDIIKHGIQIYQFPETDDVMGDDDPSTKQEYEDMKQAVPFAVVGSDTVIELLGKKVRGRRYPWGIVDVENPDHSDFLKLRRLLISTHMQDLKESTHEIHYENYRSKAISSLKDRRSILPATDPLASDLLQKKDEEIRRMQDMLQQMSDRLRQVSTPSPASSERSLPGSLPAIPEQRTVFGGGVPSTYSHPPQLVRRSYSSSTSSTTTTTTNSKSHLPSSALGRPPPPPMAPEERDTILV
ncbi:unnamed protein product [Cyprideis torosa]|uniref:Uncharacterized protein n=1 Tax=Cyprideis torosa TaxID=163714 RepID=A0A7R8ZLB0_9CRUS|nr:unnamed protein product [Cyprideis torosa]CAG0881882.1 unnamed protein product [Cyprideis torosa]